MEKYLKPQRLALGPGVCVL